MWLAISVVSWYVSLSEVLGQGFDCDAQLSNQGTRVWSGQQVQSYNANGRT